MDKGRPFRVPQPADRRVMSKPEPQRQPEVTYPAEPPRAAVTSSYQDAPATATPRRSSSASAPVKRRLMWPFIAASVVVLAIIGWLIWSNMQNSGTAIDSGKYQAVFFTNGQVYFGKLQQFNSEQLKLTDVYYLQTQNATGESKNPQETSTDQGDVQLIKLGNEIHGPEDAMIISKDQVLFYENLKSDGKVAESISKYKAPN